MGVRPLRSQDSGRVVDFELIPASILGRPRVDVTLRISGFFRDAFPHLIRLFDAVVQALAETDEAPELNPLRERVLADTRNGLKQGMSQRQAWRAARWRVFGPKPGAYGAGLKGLIDERCWEDRADLARAWLNWGGYAYDGAENAGTGNGGADRGEEADRGMAAEAMTADGMADGMAAAAADGMARGTEAFATFRDRLSGMDAVLHNQDNREHDILDSDDYYQFQGGMANAVAVFGGRDPAIYHGDHSDPARPRVHSLKEELNRVVRSRVLNPKWLNGLERHGYRGAAEMAATLDYLFAYDATTGLVEDYQYQMVCEAYLEDPRRRQFLERHNPMALKDMAERLLEAVRRGMWKEPGARELALEEQILAMEERLEQAAGPASSS